LHFLTKYLHRLIDGIYTTGQEKRAENRRKGRKGDYLKMRDARQNMLAASELSQTQRYLNDLIHNIWHNVYCGCRL
jgi:hypothetical protein